MFHISYKHYYVNKEEYYKLCNMDVIDKVPWSMRNMIVNKCVEECFQHNEWLGKLLFDTGYKSLVGGNLLEKYNIFDLDHSQSIVFKNDDTMVKYQSTVTGLLCFPYIEWEYVKEWVNKAPEGWNVYVINPCLMNYLNYACIGLFLTPSYYDDDYGISSCNNYFISQTGYPLFLKPTDKKVPVLNKIDTGRSVATFIKDVYKEYDSNDSLKEVMEFVFNNDCVSCHWLEDALQKYLELQSYTIMNHNMDYYPISSTIPFKLVHEDNDEYFGYFNKFSLDSRYNAMDVDDNVTIDLTDEQVTDLLNGKYKFVLKK